MIRLEKHNYFPRNCPLGFITKLSQKAKYFNLLKLSAQRILIFGISDTKSTPLRCANCEEDAPNVIRSALSN